MLGPLGTPGKATGHFVSYMEIVPWAGRLWLTGQALLTGAMCPCRGPHLRGCGPGITIALAPEWIIRSQF
jgi:hypothetical protein